MLRRNKLPKAPTVRKVFRLGPETGGCNSHVFLLRNTATSEAEHCVETVRMCHMEMLRCVTKKNIKAVCFPLPYFEWECSNLPQFDQKRWLLRKHQNCSRVMWLSVTVIKWNKEEVQTKSIPLINSSQKRYNRGVEKLRYSPWATQAANWPVRPQHVTFRSDFITPLFGSRTVT